MSYLIDKDKLIEEIRKAELEAFSNGEGVLYTPQGIIDLVVEQPTTMEWIPVSDKLPEINGSYVCFMRCELDGYHDGFRYHPKRIAEGYEVLEFRDDGFYTGKNILVQRF